MNKDRRARLESVRSRIDALRDEVEEIKGEEEQARDNTPEAFCDRLTQMEEDIQTMEDVSYSLQEAVDNLGNIREQS